MPASEGVEALDVSETGVAAGVSDTGGGPAGASGALGVSGDDVSPGVGVGAGV